LPVGRGSLGTALNSPLAVTQPTRFEEKSGTDALSCAAAAEISIEYTVPVKMLPTRSLARKKRGDIVMLSSRDDHSRRSARITSPRTFVIK
jgi:hypothetical protein